MKILSSFILTIAAIPLLCFLGSSHAQGLDKCIVFCTTKPGNPCPQENWTLAGLQLKVQPEGILGPNPNNLSAKGWKFYTAYTRRYKPQRQGYFSGYIKSDGTIFLTADGQEMVGALYAIGITVAKDTRAWIWINGNSSCRSEGVALLRDGYKTLAEVYAVVSPNRP